MDAGHDEPSTADTQSQRNEKLRGEAVSSLAGGIAHDFNNILGAVLGFSKFLIDDLDPSSPQHVYAERIATASERGRDLVEQIFAFSRAGREERRPENIVALIEEATSALPGLVPTASVSISASPRALISNVNTDEIGQLLTILSINAGDALIGDRGEISVTVTEVSADHDDYRTLCSSADHSIHPTDDGSLEIVVGLPMPAKRFARINVTDSGTGMTRETLAKAFDPFFTTKGRALHAGLGLAVAHNIVEASGGSCTVRTAKGIGTTVSVWLPLIDEPAG